MTLGLLILNILVFLAAYFLIRRFAPALFARIGDTMPRYPAQLFEAFAYFIIFIILTLAYFYVKKRGPGFILGLLFILIFSARFIIEPFKVEQADYTTGIALNVGQILSIPFIILGIILIIYSRHKRLN